MFRIRTNQCVQLLIRCYCSRPPVSDSIRSNGDIFRTGVIRKSDAIRATAAISETGMIRHIASIRKTDVNPGDRYGTLHETGDNRQIAAIHLINRRNGSFRQTGALHLNGGIGEKTAFGICQSLSTMAIPKRWVTTSSSSYTYASDKPKKQSVVEQKLDHLSLTVNGESFRVSYLWLRDHCRCHECFEPVCKENFVDIMAIPGDLRPQRVDVDSASISIVWPDDHVTTYDTTWLQENAPGQRSRDRDRDRQLQPFLWDRERLETSFPDDVSLSDLRDGSGLARVVEHLHVHGFVYVSGLEPTKESTEEAVNLIQEPMRTHYGDIWQFQNEGPVLDSGFTTLALKTHTDHTAYHHAAGVVILHCIYHDGDGGDNVLVDGWHAAQCLKENQPDHYRTLLETPYIAQFITEAHVFRCCDTALREDRLTGRLEQIRYNPHDRALLNYLSYEDTDRFYTAYRSLGRIIESPDSQLVVKPRPGRMLLVDNWRMLHGRTTFTGKRVMLTGYISHDDLKSLKKTVLDIDG